MVFLSFSLSLYFNSFENVFDKSIDLLKVLSFVFCFFNTFLNFIFLWVLLSCSAVPIILLFDFKKSEVSFSFLPENEFLWLILCVEPPFPFLLFELELDFEFEFIISFIFIFPSRSSSSSSFFFSVLLLLLFISVLVLSEVSP